jgi:hypothetical protein
MTLKFKPVHRNRSTPFCTSRNGTPFGFQTIALGHDDRGSEAARRDLPQGAVAVHVRKVDVEENHVGPFAHRHLHSLAGCVGRENRVRVRKDERSVACACVSSSTRRTFTMELPSQYAEHTR